MISMISGSTAIMLLLLKFQSRNAGLYRVAIAGGKGKK